jgi:phage tail sheath gpL-like
MDWLFQYTDPSVDWDFAMSTLVVRFVGVFVVMGIVQVAIQGASRVIGAVEARGAERASATADEVAAAIPAVPDLSATAEAGARVADATAHAGVADATAHAGVDDATAHAGVDDATVAANVDDATAAAIGLALALEAGAEGAAIPRVTPVAGSSSAWAMAGRLRNLRR